MFKIGFRLHLLSLNNYQRTYIEGMKGQRGTMLDALKKASSIYMTSMFERFNRFSMGGGDWAPLKPVTALLKGHDSILVDTDTLRNTLNPLNGKSGLRTAGTGGFRVGVPSGLPHPKSKLSVSELMAVHHEGNAHVPSRRILVEPDSSTMREMADAIIEGFNNMSKESFGE